MSLLFSLQLGLPFSKTNVIFGKTAALKLIAVSQLYAALQTLKQPVGSLCFLYINCTFSNPCHYLKPMVFLGRYQNFWMCFCKLRALETRTCACYNSSMRSLLACDVSCQGTGFLEFPLGFSPLLLSIAKVKVFFGSSISYCSNTVMLSTSIEPAKRHPKW